MRIALSFGGGVQSTALLLLAIDGRIPVPEVAVFADTGWESRATLAHVERMQSLAPFPIIIALGAQSIQQEAASGGPWKRKDGQLFRTLPLYRKQGRHASMGRRQCTKEYKIRPIRECLRRISRDPWTLQIGISADEAQRAKPSGKLWLTHAWPLLDLGMNRAECEALIAERLGYEVPKSSCLGCPFKTNRDWRRLRDDDPAGWQSAVDFDAALRGSGEFLHRSCLPLPMAVEEEPRLPVFDTECVGGCWL